MSRTCFPAAVAVAALLTACGGDPVAAPEGLEGLWNLPHQETPALLGYQSAQIIFRGDGSILITGRHMVSSHSSGMRTETGSWALDEGTLTLETSQGASSFGIRFDGTDAYLTSHSDDREHRIFRPLRD